MIKKVFLLLMIFTFNAQAALQRQIDLNTLSRQIKTSNNLNELCCMLDAILQRHTELMPPTNQELVHWLIQQKELRLLHYFTLKYGTNGAIENNYGDTAFHVLCCLYLASYINEPTKTYIAPVIHLWASNDPTLLRKGSLNKIGQTPINLLLDNIQLNIFALNLNAIFQPFMTNNEKYMIDSKLALRFKRLVKTHCLCCMQKCYCCFKVNPTDPHFNFWKNYYKLT